MQNPESTLIVDRFFQAIETLIENRTIKGKQPFCLKYNINRRNLWQLDKDRTKNIFQVSWLGILVCDFNVSSEWLLTGRGDMFTK